MGLSSSQGRLLMLTSRLSDIELSEIMISQRQNQLAWQSEKVASEYNEAMSNYKLTIKVTDESEDKGYSTQDLNYDNMTQMGYLATTAKNQVYLKKDDDGNWIIPTDLEGNNLLSIDNTTGKATIGTEQYEILDGTKYLTNSDTMQQAIMNGVLFLLDTKNDKDGISISSLESDTDMQYVLDTSDDAEAQSKYNYETARISRQDNQLDMELSQLETQHEAILKEYDSVKEVISNNVERTFNLFSNG